MKGDLVIESHYAHDVPNDVSVVLRCRIEELRKRLGKRGWPSRKVEENIQAEIFAVCLEEAKSLGPVVEVDTTTASPEQAVAEIRKKAGI
jgi:adenylate kinase